MFRSGRFKTKVYIDIRNNNTSSILTKQSCLLRILWLKKVIPTKSYSLAMLPLHHTKYSYHAQPRLQPSTCFHTCRGKLSSHEHLWDRSPFYVAVRERREHEEQIKGRTRAVYPGSGRADA